MSFARIMVPTDFSSDAEAALNMATELAKVCGSKLYLVHTYIVDIAPSYVGADVSLSNVQEILDQLRLAAEATLDKFGETSRKRASMSKPSSSWNTRVMESWQRRIA